MFCTEPKFTNLSNLQQLLSTVQKYELDFRPDSPITQKAIESLGLDRMHFRRRNKFELRYDFEIQKMTYNEQDLHGAYLRYLGQLINDYSNLQEQRKRIKVDFERRQREEDELRGYKWPELPIYSKPKQRIDVLSFDQKIQAIEDKKLREQQIDDFFTKDAIKLELERRKKELVLEERFQKSSQEKNKRKEDIRKKANEQNAKVQRILQLHRQSASEKLEQDFRKSKSFQEKIEARDIQIQSKKAKLIAEIASKNRKLEEKIIHFKDESGNKLMNDIQKKQQEIEFQQGKRQKTVEQLEKNRQEKQQYFQQKLNMINQKIKDERSNQELALYSKIGKQLQDKEILIEQHEKKIQGLNEAKRREFEAKFTRQRQRYIKEVELLHNKVDSWDQKIKDRQEKVLKFQRSKEEDWKSAKEFKQQNLKYHLDQVHQIKKNKEKNKMRDLQKDHQLKEKLQKIKDEQEQLRQYGTVSRQKFEQTSSTKMGELVNLKYSSSAQLLDKLKDLESEEEFLETKLNFKKLVKETIVKPPE